MGSQSINWATANFTYPAPPATPLLLYINQVVVATVTVQPNTGGITLPNAQPIPIGGDVVTYENYVYSLKATPAQLLFQTIGPAVSTSSLVSPGSTPPPAVSSAQSEPASNDTIKSYTATSAIASATATGSSKNVSPGVTSGAAAGIAIGCLLAGALIAVAALWFCRGRKRRSKGIEYEASSTALVSREKGFNAQATSLGSGSPGASPISGALPLPLEDKAITGEVSKISNSIKNHIQSYYHTGRVSSGVLDLDDIHAIGDDMPISAGTLSTLLGNTGTREIALRFCIAWVICTRIQTSATPSMSFLPAELAALSRNMGTMRSTSSVLQWRVMTAQLMQSSYVRDPFTASDSRNSSIQAALAALENLLQPYADSRMDNQERRHNLEEILKRFDWKGAQNVKSGELCIFPALVQVSNEAGQPVAPPRPFSEAVVRRLEV